MTRNYQKLLEQYILRYPEEVSTGSEFREFLIKTNGAISRYEYFPGHFTCSGFVIHGEKLLLVKHKKLGKWLQPGGHIEGAEPVISEAIREVLEETGIATKPLLGDDWFDLDRHWIPQNPKEPGHFHYDIRFLLRAEQIDLAPCDEETDGARFVEFSYLGDFTEEESILRPVGKILKISPKNK